MIYLRIETVEDAQIILYALQSRRRAYGSETHGYDVLGKAAEALEVQILTALPPKFAGAYDTEGDKLKGLKE